MPEAKTRYDDVRTVFIECTDPRDPWPGYLEGRIATSRFLLERQHVHVDVVPAVDLAPSGWSPAYASVLAADILLMAVPPELTATFVALDVVDRLRTCFGLINERSGIRHDGSERSGEAVIAERSGRRHDGSERSGEAVIAERSGRRHDGSERSGEAVIAERSGKRPARVAGCLRTGEGRVPRAAQHVADGLRTLGYTVPDFADGTRAVTDNRTLALLTLDLLHLARTLKDERTEIHPDAATLDVQAPRRRGRWGLSNRRYGRT